MCSLAVRPDDNSFIVNSLLFTPAGFQRQHAFGRSLLARQQSARNGRTAHKPLRRLRSKDSEHRRKQQTSTTETCAGAGAQAEATKIFFDDSDTPSTKPTKNTVGVLFVSLIYRGTVGGFCLFGANYNRGMCLATLYRSVCYVFVGCFGFVGLLCFVFCVCFVWLVFCVCCGWWLWCFWAVFPLGTSQALRLLWPCNRFVLCVTPLCAHFLFALSQGAVTLLTGDSPRVSRALLTSVVVVGQGSTIPFLFVALC